MIYVMCQFFFLFFVLELWKNDLNFDSHGHVSNICRVDHVLYRVGHGDMLDMTTLSKN